MWKDFISSLEKNWDFQQPATLQNIFEVEKDLDICFPDDLKGLLCETDGVKGEYSIDLIWSLKRIRQENTYFRESEDYKELYMPFECLLFFADAGMETDLHMLYNMGKLAEITYMFGIMKMTVEHGLHLR